VADKVLFVDDEPAVLDGYKRLLRQEFDVSTANGGEQGLATIHEHGPYSVVISDMRMPGMNGAQFLAQVRLAAPDTIRMLLTGHADLNAAMDAVNEGQIFRFLTKPCEKDVLGKAITTGLVQYRLVTAEKDLLENTLMGSIKVLTEVLGAASPEAFGRSMRIARVVRHLVGKFSLPSPWRFEAAAMLSQLGCITLDPELIQAAYVGSILSTEDQAKFAGHPQAARDLLVKIPRLEPIAWMISQQLISEALPAGPGATSSAEDILLGVRMLKLAVAFDNLRMKGLSDQDAAAKLHDRHNVFGQELVEALADIKAEGAKMELRKVAASKLTSGMILHQEIRTLARGLLVAAAGQEVTHTLLIKLDNLSKWGTIESEVAVLVPMSSHLKSTGATTC
jgi:response regulator RpfG family c-di-GMP phosphodiesterase